MWKNPKYFPPSAEGDAQTDGPTPPEETGHRLATLPRPARDGPAEELRVSLAEYKGHSFISMRVWREDSAGGWWPVKGKGVSVRLSELADVAEALEAAARIVDGPGSQAKLGARPADASDLSAAAGFNEFE